jgi:predicted RNase H-like HicB family nuclease
MIPIDYDVIVFKEDETCVAYCPELDISICGNTVEHAKEMLKTAVRLFLEEAEKMGTLDDAGEGRFFKRGGAVSGHLYYHDGRGRRDLQTRNVPN